MRIFALETSHLKSPKYLQPAATTKTLVSAFSHECRWQPVRFSNKPEEAWHWFKGTIQTLKHYSLLGDHHKPHSLADHLSMNH